MSKATDPNRLLTCHGESCVELDSTTRKQVKKRYPAKDLLQWPSNKSKRLCKSCFDKERNRQLEFRRLEETIMRVFKVSAVPRGLYVQIKNINNKYKISHEDIGLCLDFFINQKGKTFDKVSLGIVPYVYNEMKEFQAQQKLRSDKMSEESLAISKQTVAATKITMPYPTRKFDYRKEQLIDLEELTNDITR